MAKEKKEATETVRVRKSIIRKARMVAAAVELSLPDYLTSRLAMVVDRELEEQMAQLKFAPAAQRRKPRAPKPGEPDRKGE